MALKDREQRFSEFCNHFKHEKACSLISVYCPQKQTLERLQFAASLYAASSLADKSRMRALIADENALMREFSRQLPQIKNVTPNGMIVPKKELILEYNLFARVFMELIQEMGISQAIEAWVNPPNLRFKDGLLDPKLLERNYASEHTHSEAWIPLNTKHCYSIFVPLLGDTQNNGVEFFEPPADFEESWLDPIGAYKSGTEIASKYKKVSTQYKTGEIYIAEVATLHATTRKNNSGPRMSIDLNFIPKQSELPESISKMTRQTTLDKIGRSSIFVFKDSIHEFVDTQGASKHPTENKFVLELMDNIKNER